MSASKYDHKYLTENGWNRNGENKIGRCVQYLWTHPTLSTKPIPTSHAVCLQDHHGEQTKAGKAQLSTHEMTAIQEWAKFMGRGWKTELYYSWANGNYHGFEQFGVLQSIRNNPAFGPNWLDTFKLEGSKTNGNS